MAELQQNVDSLSEFLAKYTAKTKVRRCRLTVSKPVLKAPMVSMLQTNI